MTEHLPECAVAVALAGTFTTCICDELGACQNRIARGERARIALEIDTLMRRVKRHPNGKPESGYFEGVDDVLGILLTRVMQ